MFSTLILGMIMKDFQPECHFFYTDNSARYNGGVYPEKDANTKEYFRIDFSARQKLPWYNMELALDVNNLNNQNTSWDTKINRRIPGYTKLWFNSKSWIKN